MTAEVMEQSESELLSSEEKLSLDSAQMDSKLDAIVRACEEADLEGLVRLADATGGLLNDELRRSAWPILLGCATDASKAKAENIPWQRLPVHADEEQVQRDVDRAFVYYPTNETQSVVDARKSMLFDLIVKTLRRHPMLCYFQGYHDIIQVLLLVLGDQAAFPCVERLSLLRIRDYMLPSLSPAVKHLQLLPAILRSADQELAHHLSFTQPYFALSAALTLYAHDIQVYSDIARLFDFILAHEPIISIYLFAALIISRRKELLDIPLGDQDMLHFTLSKLPQSLDLEPLITDALKLFGSHPPERLPGSTWRKISSYSVLKTSRSVKQAQDLRIGERYFQKQTQEITREQLWQKVSVLAFRYRRPIASTFAALLVGAISIWIRRSGNDKMVWSLILTAKEFFRSGR